MTEIKVRIDETSDPDDSLQSLYDWLLDDPDIRSRAQLNAIESSPQPGQMSGELELISLLVSSGFSIGNLTIAIANWRGSRVKPKPVRIEFGDVGIVVENDDPETIANAKRLFAILQGERSNQEE